jgi:phage/plasmid-like protein (TIGR03299 family)
MPHNLEQYNNETSFAYNGAQNPWHRLGTKMEGLSTASEMLEAARADYTVTATPIYAMTLQGMAEIDGSYATVREVPEGVDPNMGVLGIVGGRYQIVQNEEVLKRALTIVGADPDQSAVVDTCGVLGRGEKFFAYVDLGTLAIDPEGVNDKITRGLGVLTSHDGTAAITYAMSNIRWVCQNTVNAGLATAERVFKARHTQNFEGALQDAQKVLGISLDWQRKFSVMAESMLRVNDGAPPAASHDLMRKIENILWPAHDDPSTHSVTIAENRQETLHSILASDTCGENFGYNGWSVYNAFVEYADHHRPRMDADRLALAAIEGSVDVWKDRVAGLVLSR